MKKDNIKVKGHKGTWYVIDKTDWYGHKFYLLEHETHGEDADHIAINAKGELVLEDITGGIKELRQYLNHKYFPNHVSYIK